MIDKNDKLMNKYRLTNNDKQLLTITDHNNNDNKNYNNNNNNKSFNAIDENIL